MNKIIDLQPLFQNTDKLLAGLQECFSLLNKLIRNKNGINKDILWVKKEKGRIHLGYIKNPNNKSGVPSDILLEYDEITNMAIIQFVIFDACGEWDLHREIKMYGAPEEESNAYFTFDFDGDEYTYKIWTES